MQTLDREALREIDRRSAEEFGLPGVVLMENAGRGAAELLAPLSAPGPVLVACGRGNNGGDGFVIARHLELRGVTPRVALWADPSRLTGDAALNFRVLQRSGTALEVFATGHDAERLSQLLEGATWIVDALLGTGAKGDPRPPLDRVIEQLNAAGRPILAVDLPSGLDCDTGQPGHPTIRAARTCTFVAPKPGFAAPGAAAHTGVVSVASIGAPKRLVDEVLSRQSGAVR